uniref:Ovule protein n=1 Tax=Ascaris lumbricoides TaxID=6252 RepID=A0A0M3I7G4_ASCLU
MGLESLPTLLKAEVYYGFTSESTSFIRSPMGMHVECCIANGHPKKHNIFNLLPVILYLTIPFRENHLPFQDNGGHSCLPNLFIWFRYPYSIVSHGYVWANTLNLSDLLRFLVESAIN